MILQKVKLARLKTEDDAFDFTAADVKIGTEFFVSPHSLAVVPVQRRDTGEVFKALMITTEDGMRIPVGILDFLNEWLVK